MSPSLDGDALIGRVVDVCNEVVCKVMVDNEEALEDAASVLLALFAEQQDEKPGARVLARIDRAGDEQRWDWIAVRWDLPGHLIAQLEGARAALGLPRRYPDIDLSSDQDEPPNR
jgi:hypothetical protein